MSAMQEGVRTLSVRAGVETVFWTCIVLMEIAYAGAIGVGLMSQVRILLLCWSLLSEGIAQTGWAHVSACS